MSVEPLPIEALRWRCDPARLPFETTAEVDGQQGIVGQEMAEEALSFGLSIRGPHEHVFVRGHRGTGRLSLVRKVCRALRAGRALRPDRVLVHNFSRPNQPEVLSLSPGSAPSFAAAMEQLGDWIESDLGPALNSEDVQAQVAALQQGANQALQQFNQALEAELRADGLALVALKTGDSIRPVILPLIDGNPTPPEKLAQLRAAGEVDDETLQALDAKSRTYAPRLRELQAHQARLQRQVQAQVEEVLRLHTRALLAAATSELREQHAEADAGRWLDELTEDLASHGAKIRDQTAENQRRYQVNILRTLAADAEAPIVVENNPTAHRLLGFVDAALLRDGTPVADHLNVQAGSLLAADGGWLVLEAADLLQNPGAWRALVRSLRAGWVEWPDVAPGGLPRPLLRPKRIDIQVRVVLLGPPGLYSLLAARDRDFGELFTVVADLDDQLPRDQVGLDMYASVMARLVDKEELPPFSACAVARIAEMGARLAQSPDVLSSRFGRLNDVGREAAFIARQQGDAVVTSEHVSEAVRRARRRGELTARRFRDSVVRGERLLTVSGTAIGQINGLAVMHAGPMAHGFPSRISATVGPGVGGTVNIEGEASLSGAIHTKGFAILGGLLRGLLDADHPLSFDASIAFEQSYGGVDGDSASGAETIVLLSALTRWPIRQDLAITGAIDQLGNLMVIGGVHAKIEGFFDMCERIGLTGTQGVVIPTPNAGGLMLANRVVRAAEAGDFAVYAVSRLVDAIELFFGRPTAEVLEQARARASALYKQSLGT